MKSWIRIPILFLPEEHPVICILDYQFRFLISLSSTRISMRCSGSSSIIFFLYYKRWLIDVHKLQIKIKVSGEFARWEQWVRLKSRLDSRYRLDSLFDRISILAIVSSSNWLKKNINLLIFETDNFHT